MNQTVREPKQAVPLRRTESRAVRRRQLIQATIESIAKHGIGGTTMATVTRIAGLSIGIVNYHFETKQKLLEETLVFLADEHHAHWQRAQQDAGLAASEKLSAIVEAHFDPQICTPKKLAVWFAFYGEARRRAVYRHLLDDYDDARLAVSTRLCAEIAAAGGYSQTPASMIAGTLEGLFDGLCLSLLMYDGTFTADQARAQVFGYLAAVFPKHFSGG